MSDVLTRSCSGCAELIVLTRQNEYQRYCSAACASRVRFPRPAWKVARTCANDACGAAFLPSGKAQRYCNHTCSSQAQWRQRRAAMVAAP